MASKAGLSGLAIAEIVSGLLLAYTGIYGLPVGYTLKYVLQGKSPPVSPTGANTLGKIESADLAAGTPASTSITSAVTASTGSVLADEALQFVGHRYVWGGPSNPASGWDCSSFVSYCLGQTGFAIPGGTWASVTSNGTTHGPVVSDYALWGGATTIPNSQAAAGDLIIYPPDTHIGIAVNSTQFCSAEDPADGTGVGAFSAGPGPYIVRRLNSTSGATTSGAAIVAHEAVQARG